MIKGGIRWDKIEQTRTLKSGYKFTGPVGMAAVWSSVRDEAMPEAMLSAAHRAAQEMEDAAVALAPWTDRTGDARRGLAGHAAQVGRRVAAALSHSVHYGIWLENRWGGRFAILPRIQAMFAPRFTKILANEIELETRGRGSKFRHRETGRWA